MDLLSGGGDLLLLLPTCLDLSLPLKGSLTELIPFSDCASSESSVSSIIMHPAALSQCSMASSQVGSSPLLMEDDLPLLCRTNSRLICLVLSSKKLLKVLSLRADSGGGSNGGVAGLVLTVRGDLTGAPAGGSGSSPAVINPFGGV